MNKLFKFCSISILMLTSSLAFAQGDVDLFKESAEEDSIADFSRIEYTFATFKSNRLVNGHTVENTHAKTFDFIIQHRFGTLNSGVQNLFGLDNASFKMAFDFGLTDRLMVGIGRSTFEKQYDIYSKYKLIRQSSGARNTPVSVSVFGSAMVKTIPFTDNLERSFTERLSYNLEAIIARKFSDRLSIQLSPGVVHNNIVPTVNDDHDIFYLGSGARILFTKRVSLNAEYFYVFNPIEGYKNALSLGFDIETGGHVFQLHFTNAIGMTQRSFITNTSDSWLDGGIHFGFNIHRSFSLVRNRG